MAVSKATLFEHREMVRYGSDATACPSGRIPWQAIIAGITQPQEDDMAGTEELLTKIELHLKNISVKADSLGNLDREMDVLLLETQRIKALIEAHAGSLPHTHQ